MASQAAPDFQDIMSRAVLLVASIASRGSLSRNKLPWSLRRSRLDEVTVRRIEHKANEAYTALFGEGHSGLVFITSKVATQEAAHQRMMLGFEYWVRDFCPELESDVYTELERARIQFGASVCKIGHYCRRVDDLFNSQVSLIVMANDVCFDSPVLAMMILDFVEYIFLEGMLPLGFEETPSGTSLQVFVCD